MALAPEEDGTRTHDSVDIRPGVNVLGVFRHLNYRPWYALAEFVDNALQSAMQNRAALSAAEGEDYVVRVDIDVSPDQPQTLTVYDTAAGIAAADFDRALKTAQPPPDRSGLSEFGVGMKSAAFWFAPCWSVRTSALGEPVERQVEFDIDDILERGVETLPIRESPIAPEAHFTEVRLAGLYQPIIGGRTIGKVKSHLASIYRRFIKNGSLTISYNGTALEHPEPAILEASVHSDLSSTPIVWRKTIDFDFGGGLKVHGFAALRQVGSGSEAGFALFRRNRLIQGSADDAYRPEQIFGKPNSFTYQRLFGELDLAGFAVTHTKDGFRWDENEQPFLDLLEERLKHAPLDLLDQAENYRVRLAARSTRALGGELDSASAALTKLHIAEAVADASALDATVAAEDSAELEESVAETASEVTNHSGTSREITFRLDERLWRVRLVLDDQTNPQELFALLADGGDGRQADESSVDATIRVQLNHAFLRRRIGPDFEGLAAILELIAALGVAELIARDAGVRFAGSIRRATNRLLRAESVSD